MTLEKQRIRIGELDGWYPTPTGYWTKNANGWPSPENPESELPNYPEDLNAMHEVEKKLVMGEQSITYLMWLGKLSCPWHATAKQRAKAFLKTFNLWEDEA